MSRLVNKRIVVSLPVTLLQEVDGVVKREKKSRSELFRQAMKLYLREQKKRQIRESLERGYQEMASINLCLAKEAIYAEEEAEYAVDRLVSGG
ncbi:MAG TPA: ribbon-helix-helix protein, CopG family [Calditerricola sp.]